ncbi:MAG: hypothetical protein ABMA25_26175, partial [Ilumatobacteraceae bacterium]
MTSSNDGGLTVANGAAARVWPTGTDYSRAVQTPQMSFDDDELKGGRVGTNAMGMPLVASGQNAVVFLMETARGNQAVRCFLTPPSEGAVRYAALEKHLVHTAPRALTSARWLANGITVSGNVWPAVVMPWVEGKPLNIAVEDMLDEPHRLRALAEQWVEVVRALQRARVAHGDLQHGNVLVKENGSIALVDLDGVWVPEITIGPPSEFGHPNYQHPQRTVEHWGQYVDSFPGALIDLALRALAHDSSLERYLSGENLLFTRQDLERPMESEVWTQLCASTDPKVSDAAVVLRERCAGPIAAVLRPFDELLSPPSAPERVEENGETVVRERVVAPAPAPSAAPTADEWWQQGASAVPSQSLAAVGPAAGAAANEASTSAGASPAATTDAPSTGAGDSSHQGGGGLLALGKNTIIAGLTGGALAGALGSVATSLFDPVLSERGETIAFVALIGLLLGGFLMSFQAMVASSWAAAARRFSVGGLCGGLAGTLAILPANAAVLALRTKGSCPSGNVARCVEPSVPLFANVLVFAIVAGFVGTALGSLRSLRTGLFAAVAGVVGGAIGGALFGATVAKYSDTAELDVYFMRPVTIL